MNGNQEQSHWKEELRQDWIASSAEEFHAKLLARFGKLFDAGRSKDDIGAWFDQIPTEYWDFSKNKSFSVAEVCSSDGHAHTSDRKKLLLESAIEAGDTRIVKFLLEAGISAGVTYTFRKNRTPLHVAAWRGYSDMVEVLISAQQDVNAIDEDHSTPLHSVADHEESEDEIQYCIIAQALVEAGAGVNEVDCARSETPLYQAIRRNHSHIVWILLDAGANCALANARFQTPLHVAVKANQTDLVKYLIDEAKIDVEALDDANQTPLAWAISAGNFEMTKLLVNDYRASTDFSKARDFAPLNAAIRSNDVELFNFLLTLETGIDMANSGGDTSEGITCLQAASKYARRGMIIELLKRGANMSARNKHGVDAFSYATHRKFKGFEEHSQYVDYLKWFLALETDYEIQFGFKIRDVFLRADLELIKLMEKRGFDLTKFQRDRLHRAILVDAMFNENKKVFKYLFEKAEVDECFPPTRLLSLSPFASPSITKYLLKKGANLNYKHDGISLVNTAVSRSSVDHVSFLLLQGAQIDEQVVDIVMKYNSGEIVFEEARKAISQLIVKYMVIREMSENTEKQVGIDVIQTNKDLKVFYIDCKNELNLMKEYVIGVSTSLFDVITDMERYSRCSAVTAEFEKQQAFDSFVLYRDILMKHYEKCSKRNKLIGKAMNSLEQIFNRNAGSLYVIFNKIIAHLSNKDLRNLALVANSVKIETGVDKIDK